MDKDVNYAEMLADISSGDRNAENLLVKQFWRGIYFIILRQTQDKLLSEDIAQQTFLVVLEHARKGKIKEPLALSSYIRQTAINLLIATRRKEARHQTDADTEFIEQAKSGSDSLLDQATESEVTTYVHKVIAELKQTRDSAIIRYHYLLDRDKKSICQLLELTPAHYDRVLHRARKRLRELIEQQQSAGIVPFETSSLTVIVVFVCLMAPDAGHEANGQTERFWPSVALLLPTTTAQIIKCRMIPDEYTSSYNG